MQGLFMCNLVLQGQEGPRPGCQGLPASFLSAPRVRLDPLAERRVAGVPRGCTGGDGRREHVPGQMTGQGDAERGCLSGTGQGGRLAVTPTRARVASLGEIRAAFPNVVAHQVLQVHAARLSPQWRVHRGLLVPAPGPAPSARSPVASTSV